MASAAELRPTVDEVALIALRTRTVGHDPAYGGLGSDTGPEDVTTFSDTTRPTASEVDEIIDSAQGYILGRLDMLTEAIPVWNGGAVRHATALYSAVLVETSYFRETVNEALIAIWQGLINDVVGSVTGAEDSAQHYTFGTLVIGTTVTEPAASLYADFMPGVDDAGEPSLLAAVATPAHNRARGERQDEQYVQPVAVELVEDGDA